MAAPRKYPDELWEQATRLPGTTTDDATRLAELEREVRQLRRAHAILRSASAFFAAELDRPQR